jgi:hypothetical protein
MGMDENYKHLYEQTKKMLAMYQDELVPGFRKQIEELEKNQVKVRCKDCKNRDDITGECKHPKAVGWDVLIPEDDDFCSYGERRTDEI